MPVNHENTAALNADWNRSDTWNKESLSYLLNGPTKLSESELSPTESDPGKKLNFDPERSSTGISTSPTSEASSDHRLPFGLLVVRMDSLNYQRNGNHPETRKGKRAKMNPFLVVSFNGRSFRSMNGRGFVDEDEVGHWRFDSEQFLFHLSRNPYQMESVLHQKSLEVAVYHRGRLRNRLIGRGSSASLEAPYQPLTLYNLVRHVDRSWENLMAAGFDREQHWELTVVPAADVPEEQVDQERSGSKLLSIPKRIFKRSTGSSHRSSSSSIANEQDAVDDSGDVSDTEISNDSRTLSFHTRIVSFEQLRKYFFKEYAKNFLNNLSEGESSPAEEVQTLNFVELQAIVDSLFGNLFSSYQIHEYDKESTGTFTIEQVSDILDGALLDYHYRGLSQQTDGAQNILQESIKIEGKAILVLNDDDSPVIKENSATNGNASNQTPSIVTRCFYCEAEWTIDRNTKKPQQVIAFFNHISMCRLDKQADHFLLGSYLTEAEAARRWYVKLMHAMYYGQPQNFQPKHSWQSFFINALSSIQLVFGLSKPTTTGYESSLSVWSSEADNEEARKYFTGNSAIILVKERETGQLMEERMPTYLRLGMRLLYQSRGAGTLRVKMIKKLLRDLSIRQGSKFDQPESVRYIQKFVNYHRINLKEVFVKGINDGTQQAEPTIQQLMDYFPNFNAFFARQLIPGARSVCFPGNPKIVSSAADCRLVVFEDVADAQRVWIKGKRWNVHSMLTGEPVDKLDHKLDDPENELAHKLASDFETASCAIFRLAPQDYHRFHYPVDAKVEHTIKIPGEYYTVNPMAIRHESDVTVFCDNVRTVTYMFSPLFGKIAYICIGAMMVGSIVLFDKDGDYVKRGDERGYFQHGGSTCIVLFPKNSVTWDPDLIRNSMEGVETLVRVGTKIGEYISNE